MGLPVLATWSPLDIVGTGGRLRSESQLSSGGAPPLGQTVVNGGSLYGWTAKVTQLNHYWANADCERD